MKMGVEFMLGTLMATFVSTLFWVSLSGGRVLAAQPAPVTEPSDATMLRDCEDGFAVFARVVDYKDWKPGKELPSPRFYNAEGEIVSYHLPPPRPWTGPGLGSSAIRVRREAGHPIQCGEAMFPKWDQKTGWSCASPEIIHTP